MDKSKYRFLLWELIAAMDTDVAVGIDEANQHLRDGTASALLTDRFGSICDFSMMNVADWRELDQRFADLSNVVDAKRKFGVQRNGLCLVMACTLQCLQDLDR